LAILVFVEPGALDVEELETGDASRQPKRVDRELGNRRIGASVGFVVQDVDTPVPDLQEIDVARDRSLGAAVVRRQLDAMLALECGDIALIQPDWDLDRDGNAVVAEHEALQRLVAQLVVAYRWNDERGCVGSSIAF